MDMASQIETMIEIMGIAAAAEIEAKLVLEKIENTKVAYQFILEELDGASRGNESSQQYARSSGIPIQEYVGALDDSVTEVDGPEGPQHFVMLSCLQLRNDPDLMAEFRCKILDNIMRKYRFGKYANELAE